MNINKKQNLEWVGKSTKFKSESGIMSFWLSLKTVENRYKRCNRKHSGILSPIIQIKEKAKSHKRNCPVKYKRDIQIK